MADNTNTIKDAIQIRPLRPDEIDIRVGIISEKGVSFLLYKDARCDMNILDETFGIFGWKREHNVKDGKEFCTVSVYDNFKGEWISKEDTGTESNTEKEKGLSSDAFKRACVNFGIGRELYTAPFIFNSKIPTEADANGKWRIKGKLAPMKVTEIESLNKVITKLVIVNAINNEVVFRFAKR